MVGGLCEKLYSYNNHGWYGYIKKILVFCANVYLTIISDADNTAVKNIMNEQTVMNDDPC